MAEELVLGSAAAALPKRLRRGSFWDFVRRMQRVRMALPGALIVLFFILLALLADIVAPRNPLAQNLSNVLQPPSLGHLLGTDDLGRDVLSRVIFGSRVSLEVGLFANLLALVVGVPLGLIAGFSKNMLDGIIMRIMDGVLAFPALVLAIAIGAVLGPNLLNLTIAIGVVHVPYIARLVRGETLSVREREFVTAAMAIGARDGRIILRHILPNVVAPVMVQSSLNISHAIITEAALSFLGVGIQPPTPSWGSMLQSGYRYLESTPWLALSPGIAIFLAVLGFNFVGDGLRNALDPRVRQR